MLNSKRDIVQRDWDAGGGNTLAFHARRKRARRGETLLATPRANDEQPGSGWCRAANARAAGRESESARGTSESLAAGKTGRLVKLERSAAQRSRGDANCSRCDVFSRGHRAFHGCSRSLNIPFAFRAYRVLAAPLVRHRLCAPPSVRSRDQEHLQSRYSSPA